MRRCYAANREGSRMVDGDEKEQKEPSKRRLDCHVGTPVFQVLLVAAGMMHSPRSQIHLLVRASSQIQPEEVLRQSIGENRHRFQLIFCCLSVTSSRRRSVHAFSHFCPSWLLTHAHCMKIVWAESGRTQHRLHPRTTHLLHLSIRGSVERLLLR